LVQGGHLDTRRSGAAVFIVVTRIAPAAEVVVELAPDPRSGRVAREAVLELADKLHSETMAKVRLLVTELVVAALSPAENETLVLSVRVDAGVVRAELRPSDEATGLAEQPRPRSWSLFLVNRIADRWGADDGGVWFELDAR
jgi:hypothetical protein